MKRLKFSILSGLFVLASPAFADDVLGDIIMNGQTPYHYYDDLNSADKLSALSEKCQERGQRLPKASEMARFVSWQMGFAAYKADLTVKPEWWAIWKSEFEQSPEQYLHSKAQDWAQIYRLHEEGEEVALYTVGADIGRANPIRESFENRSRSLLNYLRNVSGIRDLTPDVFLTQSQLISRDIGFRMYSPEITKDSFTTVGIGTSVYGSGGNPDMAAYLFISKLDLLEPRTKESWTNPVPLSLHNDFYQNRSGIHDNPHLRVLVQCFK